MIVPTLLGAQNLIVAKLVTKNVSNEAKYSIRSTKEAFDLYVIF